MYRKLIHLSLVILLSGSFANAADVHWSGAGGDNLWDNPANWDSHKVPGPGDNVFVDVPAAKAPNGPLVRNGMFAGINGLSCEVAGEPTMTMTGGTLEIGDYIWWGDGQDSHGTFTMSGGTITVGAEFELGWGGGTGTWIMTGGEITCAEFIVPTDSGKAGQMYLNGGTINVGSSGLEMNANGLIDVAGGTLIFEGDLTAQINGLIDAEQIVFYGGGGLPSLDYDLRNPGKTTLTARYTGKAYNPNPADGSYHEETWASISWAPAESAVSHDIYFGDNYESVNDGAEQAFVGNQTSTFFVVGFPGYPYEDGLIPGTTYYWRIDEVEADGTIRTGDIWSFTVPPKIAYNPVPADGAGSVDTDVVLQWTVGFGSKLHTVYFGDNFDDVNNASGGSPQGSTSYTPDTLELGRTYYWRVDEFDAESTYKGDVWSFTTQGAVGGPAPSNGAEDVKQTTILTWSPSDHAASHRIYFGADKAAVRNADTAAPQYKGDRDLGSESYDPGKLEWNTTYYWRIDEVNDTNADSPWIGPVWSFTTADFLVVDDFESYNALNEDEPGSNRIYLAWIDGFEDPENGSVVGYESPPFTEQANVHNGNQSMPFTYDNSVGKSEATLTLTYPRDWTEKGVNTLTIWYVGKADNSAETMYVVLNGSAAVDNDNPDAALAEEWTRWNIDLQLFADQGVNLANVDTITIGLGDRSNPTAGGAGMLFFDDIRLYVMEPLI
jgi:hypothetical protein